MNNEAIMDARSSQVLILITDELDIIRHGENVKTLNGNVLMYVVDEDGLERIALGSSMKPFIENYPIDPFIKSKNEPIGNYPIDQFIKCKNGLNGWIEFYNSKNEKQKINSPILLYLAIDFPSGTKPPKVKTYISNLKE